MGACVNFFKNMFCPKNFKNLFNVVFSKKKTRLPLFYFSSWIRYEVTVREKGVSTLTFMVIKRRYFADHGVIRNSFLAKSVTCALSTNYGEIALFTLSLLEIVCRCILIAALVE